MEILSNIIHQKVCLKMIRSMRLCIIVIASMHVLSYSFLSTFFPIVFPMSSIEQKSRPPDNKKELLVLNDRGNFFFSEKEHTHVIINQIFFVWKVQSDTSFFAGMPYIVDLRISIHTFPRKITYIKWTFQKGMLLKTFLDQIWTM